MISSACFLPESCCCVLLVCNNFNVLTIINIKFDLIIVGCTNNLYKRADIAQNKIDNKQRYI